MTAKLQLLYTLWFIINNNEKINSIKMFFYYTKKLSCGFNLKMLVLF